ncbi:endonuclease/exonuclease/phosphatase family protein [Streptococcus sp. DD04]|uniref:endonuclease/exonuclease/phosphatase family protein n=1 Tax=Streptococcus sp. DD04 TaxID=1776578 RepID=UPI00078635EA|nr:endonuclease/exonuclease/phosphatase family protein [Streptococcus sp. DD04]KXT62874.1 hypothetical protein STRDD04_02016 [Streptococcus sp. DD04]
MTTSLTILSANLDFMGAENYNRSCEQIAQFLVSYTPTFIALQEIGTCSKKDMLQDEDLFAELELHGYKVLPHRNSRNPVNSRLLYNSSEIDFIEKLPPLYTEFENRQSGGLFNFDNQTIAIYSLHFPLYGRYPLEKKEMWDKSIQFASQTGKLYDHVILAGDFNESLINRTTLSDKIIEMEQYMVNASLDLPTWKTKKLDHIFITPHTKIENYSTLDNKFSDHKALQLTFSI